VDEKPEFQKDDENGEYMRTNPCLANNRRSPSMPCAVFKKSADEAPSGIQPHEIAMRLRAGK
jgi:hypothetical protein